MYYALMCGIWAQLIMERLVSSIVLYVPSGKNGFFLAPRGHSRPAPRILHYFLFPIFLFALFSLSLSQTAEPNLRARPAFSVSLCCIFFHYYRLSRGSFARPFIFPARSAARRPELPKSPEQEGENSRLPGLCFLRLTNPPAEAIIINKALASAYKGERSKNGWIYVPAEQLWLYVRSARVVSAPCMDENSACFNLLPQPLIIWLL